MDRSGRPQTSHNRSDLHDPLPAPAPPSTPPPATAPSVPAGWLDDPGDSTSLRYWDGSKWTDNRSAKPPGRSSPPAVALDGWVDVMLSTVPGVVITSTKGNHYRVYAHTGDLSVATTACVEVASFEQGTYSAELSMGTKTVRKTPTWAIVLGIIGTIMFLIGFLLFFVKENRQEESRILTVTLTDGRSFSGPYTGGVSYG